MIKWQARKFLAACTFAGACVSALAAPPQDASRGEMLYSIHCIGCHTTHVHWRDQRLATDWESLAWQVRRWQGNAGLGWNDEDVAAVTRYLNTLYYHFPAGTEEKALSMETGKR